VLLCGACRTRLCRTARGSICVCVPTSKAASLASFQVSGAALYRDGGAGRRIADLTRAAERSARERDAAAEAAGKASRPLDVKVKVLLLGVSGGWMGAQVLGCE
jgi:hypothetical protein